MGEGTGKTGYPGWNKWKAHDEKPPSTRENQLLDPRRELSRAHGKLTMPAARMQNL
jgi:hypothetical protein